MIAITKVITIISKPGILCEAVFPNSHLLSSHNPLSKIGTQRKGSRKLSSKGMVIPRIFCEI